MGQLILGGKVIPCLSGSEGSKGVMTKSLVPKELLSLLVSGFLAAHYTAEEVQKLVAPMDDLCDSLLKEG